MPTLSATTLAKMQPGDILRDDQIKGLHAKAKSSGISFFLYFRDHRGKERRPKIGDYGVITLPQARDVARTWLLKKAKGETVRPALTPSDKKTVTDLYEEWQRLHKPKLKAETARGMECQWKVHILPVLGKMIVADVTDDDVAEMFSDISEDTPTIANRVLSLLSLAFKMAEKRPLKWRPQHSNPCYGIERNPENERRRYLSLEELQRLGAVLADWEIKGSWWRKASRYFRLLILTGARKNEIAKAKREWLDLDNQLLRLPDSKTGEKVIGLPSSAVKLIRTMLAEDPESEWLCPGMKPQNPMQNHWTAWKNLLKEAKIEDFRIHDLRHSFASVGLSMSKKRLEDIGPMLGHSDVETTKRYAHLMVPAHVAMAEEIGSKIESLLLPAPTLQASPSRQ